jgi:hypothetical protein
MGKETLVVFWSFTGSTKEVALETARYLNADVEELVDKTNWTGFAGSLNRAAKATVKGCSKNLEPTKFDPGNYKKIIILSPFWGPTVTPTVRTYLKNNRAKIDSIWLIVTYGYSGLDKCEREIKDMGYVLKGILGIKTGISRKDGQMPNIGGYKPELHEFLKQI